jgi:hypothetical protein
MREIRRLVFLFAGFEPYPAEAQRARFAHAADKTGRLWDCSFDVGALTPGLGGFPEFHVSAHAAGWRAETEIVVCDWSDLIAEIQSQNPLQRFFSGLAALTSFVLNGTFVRYCRVGWRYGVFFVIPLVLILGALLPLSLASFGPGGALAGVLISGLLFWFFNSRLYLTQTLDNWQFARSAALGRDMGIERRIAQVKAAIVERVESFDADGRKGEVVIAAHSLGAYFATMALGGALGEIKSSQFEPGLLLAGSSLLKVALHPKARRLREAVGVISRSQTLWLDIQSLTDILNFYRADPVAALGLTANRKPVLQSIRFRAILTPETYRRIRFNWLRVHRQYVLADERRTNYSFHMMLAGPYRFAELMEHRGLPQNFAAGAETKDVSS